MRKLQKDKLILTKKAPTTTDYLPEPVSMNLIDQLERAKGSQFK